jgi:hypothetical protein
VRAILFRTMPKLWTSQWAAMMMTTWRRDRGPCRATRLRATAACKAAQATGLGRGLLILAAAGPRALLAALGQLAAPTLRAAARPAAATAGGRLGFAAARSGPGEGWTHSRLLPFAGQRENKGPAADLGRGAALLVRGSWAPAAHLHDSRAAYQKSLRTDKDVLDSHRAAVMDFIDAKKSGRHRVALKRTGQATY